MSSNAEIPCATCLLWKPKEKSFTCDPNTCKKLTNWLMKEARVDKLILKKKMVQYIV